jgi:hypothetical protein
MLVLNEQPFALLIVDWVQNGHHGCSKNDVSQYCVAVVCIMHEVLTPEDGKIKTRIGYE